MEKSEILLKASELFSMFESKGVKYCHWKSNAHLELAVRGKEDLDVLISRNDYIKCMSVLADLEFKRAISISSSVHPSTDHYYALDEGSSKLVHLHLYYQVITGDSLVKCFRLPIDSMLLENTRVVEGVKVPPPEAELITLVVRSVLKQGRFVERKLFDRERGRVKHEYEWLSKNVSEKILEKLLYRYLPELTLKDIADGYGVFSNDLSIIRRYLLCKKYEKALAGYRRYSHFVATLHSLRLTFILVINRIFKRKGAMIPATGGAVIGLVGPQATGKSTISNGLKNWLGKEFSIVIIHAGKPATSIATLLPNLLLPLARRLIPERRSSHIETHNDSKANYSLLHIFRVIFLAYDRKNLLHRMHRIAARGCIVVSDRYPSLIPGAIDSRHFSDKEIMRNPSRIKRALMKVEANIYSRIPPPTIVIELTVPVDVAVERDLKRVKAGKKDSDYVRRRHAMSIRPEFDCPVVKVSTLDEYSKSEVQIRNIVWNTI
jgi:thymidylate kinase